MRRSQLARESYLGSIPILYVRPGAVKAFLNGGSPMKRCSLSGGEDGGTLARVVIISIALWRILAWLRSLVLLVTFVRRVAAVGPSIRCIASLGRSLISFVSFLRAFGGLPWRLWVGAALLFLESPTMRAHGRPMIRRLPRQLWGRGRPPTRYREVGVGGGVVVSVSSVPAGALLVAKHAWTGRVLRQLVVGWDDWLSIDVPTRLGVLMSFFKKPNGAPVGKGQDKRIEDKDLLKEAPTLAAYLQEDAWPDGEARQRSTMVVFVEEGTFKACLSEKDAGMSLWAASGSFWGILEAMEARLTEDRPDWRKARVKKKGG